MIRKAFSTSVSTLEARNFHQELLKSYLRKSTNLFLCVNNVKFAERVCSVIGDQLSNRKMLFEASPGSGILTRQLLEKNVPKMRCFEHLEKNRTRLKALQTEFGSNRLEIVDKQIIDFVNGNYKLLNISREEMLKDCFDGISIQENWSKQCESESMETEDKSFQFLTVISPFLARDFLTYMVYSLSHFDSFFITGPTEFFLFMPLSYFKQLLMKPSRNLKHYTAFIVHFNSFFDYNDIDLPSFGLKGIDKLKIDNSWHTIISSEHFEFTNDRLFRAKENFIFVRIKPKPMIKNYDSEFLMNYVTFVKQSFSKRSNYAIRYYEKHFPGCAIDLIGLGISYFKTLGDLTSEEMFQIFSHFYHLPQFQTSIFKELC
ncbi:hypothetical protein BLOT_014754 [Blomia tropicalis]|nr:hypothetical protein BLOT_014754 [Blomia tropicalis]